jgi:segregation and condensation protein B
MFYSHLKKHVEALLFASGEPLSARRIADILDIAEEHVLLLVEQLHDDMRNSDRGLTIVEIAGGYQLCTLPELASVVEKLAQTRESRLSSAAMETLAIIAFKQPVTRQEIENIRGVKVDKLLSTLMERNLVKELGRKEVIGRPILYGTTAEFLQCFGLKSLEDLPPLSEFLKEQP